MGLTCNPHRSCVTEPAPSLPQFHCCICNIISFKISFWFSIICLAFFWIYTKKKKKRKKQITKFYILMCDLHCCFCFCFCHRWRESFVIIFIFFCCFAQSLVAYLLLSCRSCHCCCRCHCAGCELLCWCCCCCLSFKFHVGN